MSESRTPQVQTVTAAPPALLASLAELWQSRHLALLLVQRDLRLRYKQTALGALWAFLQPLMTALVFGVVFGVWIRIPSDGVPYFPFVLVGIAAWMFFAGSVQQATHSLVANTSLVTRVYFHRAVLPVSAVGLNFADLLVTSAVVAAVLFGYELVPGARVAWVLAALALLFSLTLGVSLATAALSVYYRDFPNLVPVGLQLLLFASPVVYPTSIIPAHIAAWTSLNPLVGIIALLRWAVFGARDFPAREVAVSAPLCIAALVAGWLVFRHLERKFADSI